MIAGAGWHQSLVIAIAVLIITCPCALGLAVPAAQVVASGALARRGLLVKDGSALERLAEIDTALFDKTGTLTQGEPIAAIGHLTPEQKAIGLALAQSSRHPLSRGIATAVEATGIRPASPTAVAEVPGRGVSGLLGKVPVSLTRGREDRASLATILSIGSESVEITFTDPVREDATPTLDALRAMGVRSRIVSGDRDAAVEALAAELGIIGEGGKRPESKLALLEALKADGHRPLMVGDGINDGPAMAAAHASIAPGTASDVSQQAADAVFVGRSLMPVVAAVAIARRTMRIVRQNFGFAIGYNVLAVPLAIAGLVTPLIAAIAMSLSSLIVVGNSLRLAKTGSRP
jgi:Cu2+-exporting ATPase